jgi:hypothetical protein
MKFWQMDSFDIPSLKVGHLCTIYRPGLQQGKADALSRWSYLAPRPCEAAFDDQQPILLGLVRLQAVEVSTMPLDSNILNSIHQDIHTDPFAQEVLAHIDLSRASYSKAQHPHVDYCQFTWQNGSLFYKGLIYVPDGSSRIQVLPHCHDTYLAGHFGIQKTFELVRRAPKLHSFVEEYVRTCDTCCRTKMSRHHPFGLLHPYQSQPNLGNLCRLILSQIFPYLQDLIQS